MQRLEGFPKGKAKLLDPNPHGQRTSSTLTTVAPAPVLYAVGAQ